MGGRGLWAAFEQEERSDSCVKLGGPSAQQPPNTNGKPLTKTKFALQHWPLQPPLAVESGSSACGGVLVMTEGRLRGAGGGGGRGEVAVPSSGGRLFMWSQKASARVHVEFCTSERALFGMEGQEGRVQQADASTSGGPAPVRSCLGPDNFSFASGAAPLDPLLPPPPILAASPLFSPLMAALQIVNARLRVVIEATASVRCSDETRTEEFTVRTRCFSLLFFASATSLPISCCARRRAPSCCPPPPPPPPGLQHRRGVGGNRRPLDLLPAVQRIRRLVLHPRQAKSPHIFSLAAFRYSNITRLEIHGLKLPPFPSKFVKSSSPQIIQVRVSRAPPNFPRF
jgi:hypothetical protein